MKLKGPRRIIGLEVRFVDQTGTEELWIDSCDIELPGQQRAPGGLQPLQQLSITVHLSDGDRNGVINL